MIDQELWQSGQSNRLGLFKKGIDGVLQDVLGARAPVVGVEIPQNADQGGNNKRALAAVNRLQDVEADDAVSVGRVEVNNIVGTRAGDGLEEVFNKGTVGIDCAGSAGIGERPFSVS